MNYPLKSLVDQLALNELINARADLGKIGGLFKMWLSRDENKGRKLGNKSYQDIQLIIMNIETKQSEILEIATNLINIKK
jgi:hypothetical protein